MLQRFVNSRTRDVRNCIRRVLEIQLLCTSRCNIARDLQPDIRMRDERTYSRSLPWQFPFEVQFRFPRSGGVLRDRCYSDARESETFGCLGPGFFG